MVGCMIIFSFLVGISLQDFPHAYIGVIIDDSVSVFDDDFMKEKEFIYRIYQFVNPVDCDSKISVGKFSTESSLMISFADAAAVDVTAARKIIDCCSQTKGKTCTDLALNMAQAQMFTSNITNSNLKILILITDGCCNCAGCSELSAIAKQLKEKDVNIITIGVGLGIDENELKDIATLPTYFYSVKSFDELLDVLINIFDAFQKMEEKYKLEQAQLLSNDIDNNTQCDCANNSDVNAKDSNYPYMNPIIVNIQTCPNSKVQHVGCKPASSRCFNIERGYLLNPTTKDNDKCRCSEMALNEGVNYFKIDKKAYCTIGTLKSEKCIVDEKRMKICKNEQDILYLALNN